jgi:hypothetical protein
MNLITLGQARERVEELSRHCWDETVPVKEIQFAGLEKMLIAGEEHRMKPIAQHAISNRLGIPFHYLQKCDSDLQAVNLNRWMEQEKNDRPFVRFDGNDVRAVFTPRYTPIDNLRVLHQLETNGYSPETNVQCSLDGEFMLLNIPDKEKAFKLNGKDEMRPGISIANSEVGLLALTISAFVLRLVCTNGLISKTSVDSSYRHISERILREFPTVLNQVSHDLDKQRNQWVISMESEVKDPPATIKSFNRQFQLEKKEEEAVDWAWEYELGDRMFHIVNSYTRAAQFNGLTAESGYRLQKVGGSILAMLN